MFPSVPPKGLTGLLFVQIHLGNFPPDQKNFVILLHLCHRCLHQDPHGRLSAGQEWQWEWKRLMVLLQGRQHIWSQQQQGQPDVWSQPQFCERKAEEGVIKISRLRLLKLQSHAINHTSLCQMQTQATLCSGLFCCPSQSSIFADQSQWLFKIGNSVLSDEALLISRQISNMIALCELCIATRALPGLPTCFKRCHAMLQNALLTPNALWVYPH